MKDLTLLLLVKGREKFSFRWLDYLSKNQSKCKIYVADGSEKKQSLEKYSTILDYKYEYFGEDVSIELFLNKIIQSLKNVETEFVMLCSNDDFVILENIKILLKELKSNKESIGIKGRSVWINLEQNQQINGMITNFKSFQTPDNLRFNNILDRIKNFLKNYNGHWHAILNRKILLKIFIFLLEKKVFDIFVIETFLNIALILEGNIIASKKVYIFNQDHLDRLSHDMETLQYDIEKIRGKYFEELINDYLEINQEFTFLERKEIWKLIDKLFENHFIIKKNVLNKSDKSKFTIVQKIKDYVISNYSDTIIFKAYLRIKLFVKLNLKENKEISYFIKKINNFLSNRKKSLE